jgi:hypothetical protein
MLRNILFQLLALISNIVTQPWRQARFHTVWSVCETACTFLIRVEVDWHHRAVEYLAYKRGTQTKAEGSPVRSNCVFHVDHAQLLPIGADPSGARFIRSSLHRSCGWDDVIPVGGGRWK